jgi:hypothetical protein
VNTQADQQRLTELVFAITGDKLPKDDPLVVAALYYAATLREAAKDAATMIISAGEIERGELARIAVEISDDGANARLAVEEAKRLLRSASTAQQALADSFENRMTKTLRETAKLQAKQDGQGMVSLVHALLGALAALLSGAVLFAFGTAAVCGYSFSWVNDASVGRAFLRSLPTMDPRLRQKLIDHVKHSQK